MTKRVTLKDIAQISGYSVNCVSRALMDSRDISENTKEKIREIANQLGYVQNMAAASLRNSTSKTIGIVYDCILNPYYSIILHYAGQALLANGYNYITFINTSALFNTDTVKNILSRNVDGILSLISPDRQAQTIIEREGIPTVILGRKIESEKIDCVVLDNEKGGYLAGKYLLNKGCKRMRFIGDGPNIDCMFEREAGFIKALNESGISVAPHEGDYKQYVEEVKDLLEINDIDGVFCFNDMIVFEVMEKCKQSGKKIEIVGFDNLQREFRLPLDVVSVGYDKKAFVEIAIDKLIRKVEKGAKENRSVTVCDVNLKV